MAENKVTQIKAFFGEGEGYNKVTMDEFNSFWKSLSDDEKKYYKTADLS